MGAFTLQGMSFVLYKLLMQENSTIERHSWMDRDRARKMGMQQVMANKQMEVEMKLQEAQFMRQLNMLEHQNELEMNGIESGLLNAAEDKGGMTSVGARL